MIYGNEESKNVPVTAISIQELKQAMEVFSINSKPAKTSDEAMKKSYQFWSTQPVPRMGKIETYTLASNFMYIYIYMNCSSQITG